MSIVCLIGTSRHEDTMFSNRTSAGRKLASKLTSLALDHPLVFALPRGGVPVAIEVATALGADLDVFVVRKLGAPFQPELAMGAIASGGARVINPEIYEAARMRNSTAVDAVETREREELARREEQYRGSRPFPAIEGRHVVLVDDGVATGATLRVAIIAVRESKPASLTVAVPTASVDALRILAKQVDNVICLETPAPFRSVSQSYREFGQVTDEEVQDALERFYHGPSKP